MKFEVYCDESLPDILTSENPSGQYLMIGSLWLPSELRSDAKSRINELRQKHSVHGEVKWRKISPSRKEFYVDLIDLFFSFGMDMRFRCIAVDRNQINMAWHGGDAELGFYKFYYQVLHHWILDNNDYTIFCDLKVNRDRTRLNTLKTVLTQANRTSRIEAVQSLPSEEVSLLQACDVLLGAASSRLNQRTNGSAKEDVIQHLESRLDRKLGGTPRNERKFNVFKIQLKGGW